MLFERIADKEPEKSFEHIPDPIGYRLADGAQLALATKIASGGKAAYVGAMGAKAGSTAMGTMGATTSTGAGGAIGGSTAAGSTAAGTTAASTTTTTTAAAATSSTAATTSTTAGASGASHIGLGAKAATFGTKAGLGTKSALGAKAVAAMHTPHAAAIGSGMVKVGIAAAYTHPVSCLAMTGGLAYLAFRGKRGKGWIKRNRDVTGFELLVGEDVAFEMAENGEEEGVEGVIAEVGEVAQERIGEEGIEGGKREEGMEGGQEEANGELGEEGGMKSDEEEAGEQLADDLKLGLIMTEPTSMDTVDEEITTRTEDPRRAQTTI
ncbi:MAG: hypothetical protein Q9204_009338 [Flavoplaca sp. TL-2023a]